MSWVVAAALTLVSLPFLIARGAGGQPPNPGPKLAALAPAGIVPAVAGVAVAARVLVVAGAAAGRARADPGGLAVPPAAAQAQNRAPGRTRPVRCCGC